MNKSGNESGRHIPKMPKTILKFIAPAILALLLGACKISIPIDDIDSIPFSEIERTDELGQKITRDIGELMLEGGFDLAELKVYRDGISESELGSKENRFDGARFAVIKLKGPIRLNEADRLVQSIEERLGGEHEIITGNPDPEESTVHITFLKKDGAFE